MKALAKTEKSIALAGTSFQGVKVREVESDDLKGELYDQILLGYRISQTNLPNDYQREAQVMCELVSDRIQSEFGMLTMAEIKQAWKDGFFGAYGKFYGVSPITLIGFLTSYSSSDKRKKLVQDSKKSILEIPEKSEVRISLDEKRKFWDECKSDFLKSGYLKGEIYLHKIGVELGEIDLKDDMFIEEVKFLAKQRLEKIKLETIEKKGLGAKREVREINQLIESVTPSGKTWGNVCKRVAVELAFRPKEIKSYRDVQEL